MGDLDCGAPRYRVAVEGEQPLCPEGVEHGLDAAALASDGGELATENSAAGVAGALAEGYQAEEQLPGCRLGVRVHAGV